MQGGKFCPISRLCDVMNKYICEFVENFVLFVNASDDAAIVVMILVTLLSAIIVLDRR